MDNNGTPTTSDPVDNGVKMFAMIDLYVPFKDGAGQMVRTLKLSRPTIAQRLSVENPKLTDLEVEANLFKKLVSGLAPEEFDKIDMYDYQQLQKAAGGFMQGGEADKAVRS